MSVIFVIGSLERCAPIPETALIITRKVKLALSRKRNVLLKDYFVRADNTHARPI